MIGWLRSVIANLGLVPEVAKPEKAESVKHSEELRKRADRIYNDLRQVRRIEIIVRRR